MLEHFNSERFDLEHDCKISRQAKRSGGRRHVTLAARVAHKRQNGHTKKPATVSGICNRRHKRWEW